MKHQHQVCNVLKITEKEE